MYGPTKLLLLASSLSYFSEGLMGPPFAYLLVTNTLQLLVVQLGLGLAEAISTPSWDAFYASQLRCKDDTFAWGIAGGHPQFIFAIAIGGLIAEFVSFRAQFVTVGVLSLAATAVQALPPSPAAEPSRRCRHRAAEVL